MRKYFTCLFFLSRVISQIDYATQIQPIFDNKCTSCHDNGGGYAGNLDLSSYALTMEGGNNGSTVVPSDHSSSELFARVTLPTSDQQFMPKYNDPLPQAEIDLIVQWIDEGALETPLLDSDCIADDGTDGVELWDNCYSIDNTTQLYMENSQLTGDIPSEIGQLINLTLLRLNNNQLTGIIPPEIGNLVHLEYLILMNNQFEGEIPSEIGNLTNLVELYVGNNQLTGIIPPEIGNLVHLEWLSIWRNNLHGEIPSDIGNLSSLKLFDAAENQLSGSIPPEIGNMTELLSINLHSNQLSGSIPEEIGNLISLSWLALADNNLSGEIPQSICNLNVGWSHQWTFSNNRLCPPYPSCIEEFVVNQDISSCFNHLVTINEIMNNPSSVQDSEGEWFELFYNGDFAIDLNGWTIKDNGSDSHVISSSLIINPGEYLVLSNNNNYDYQYDGITLGNGGDEIILIDPNGTTSDSVAYDGGPEFPDLSGASMALVDYNSDNSIGSSWQASTTVFGDGDLGTPGLPNFASDIDVELYEIDFDTVLVGEFSDKVLSILNTGNTTLVIDSIYTSSESITLPIAEIHIETNYELVITFTPSEYGIVEDTLIVISNDPDESYLEIPLIAFGYIPSPNIVLESTNIDFGIVMDGLTEAIELHVANDGDAPLSLASVYIEESTAFTIPNYSTSVAENDTGSIEIIFSPDDEASFSGTMYIVSNDPDTDTLMVPLSGIGGQQAPIMVLSDAELYFGTVQPGTSVEREVIIYNEGILDLEIEEVIITGSDYYTTTFSDATIDPGDSVLVEFIFAPSDQAAEAMASASFASNAGTQTIELKAGYYGPVWHVATIGTDETGDGTEVNPFATIQKGVDMSGSGDTVLVHPGIYNEHEIMSSGNVFLNRDSLHLISTSGPASTIIDGENNGMLIRELAINMFIEGFTLTGASAYYDYYMGNSNGAIGTFSERFRVETISIKNTIFVGNQMDINFAFGNAYSNNDNLDSPLNAIISNCTFISSSNDFPSIRIRDYDGTYNFSSIIFFTENDQNNFQIESSDMTALSHSLISPNVNIPDWFFESGENVYGDPLFCSSENGDFSLAANSPAVGTGQDGVDIGALGVDCEAIEIQSLWHVATTGSDETGDGTELNPFATIEKAEQFANQYYNPNYENILFNTAVGQSIDPGWNVTDTILVHPGTYYISELRNGSIDYGSDLVTIIKSVSGPDSTFLLPMNEYSHIGATQASYDISGFTISELELLYFSSFVYLNNCLVKNMKRIDGGSCGFGDYCYGFENVTFVNNDNYEDYDFNGYPLFYNSIIYGNENFYEDVLNSGDTGIIFTINDIGFSSSGNIFMNPLFCNPENGDFSLAANSPALAAGENGVNMGALGVGCEAIELAIDAGIAPSLYALHQNYPNPFNPTTKIRYDIPEASVVTLSIYNLMGKEVRTLINSEQSTGFKNIQWNATNDQGKPVPAGVYVYTIQAGDFRQTKKMILLK